ncbi:hypothetical protein [Maridesulfovibrio sp.]|uniref:hypothetical protein n=1 Tax=Maridesulfovibrio sp. TaxID=2795000 RepID=UPI003B00D5D8
MFNLPGPQRFFRQVINDIKKNKHIVLVMPEILHDKNITETLNILCKNNNIEEIHEADIGPHIEQDVYCAIENTLTYGEERLPTCRDILMYPESEVRLYFLKNGYKGDPKRQKKFSRQLAMFAKETHRQEGDTEIQFIILASPGDVIPDSDLYLAVHPWWGTVGELDTAVAIEEQLKNSPPPHWTDHYWLRSLSRGLAQGDPELGKQLVEDLPKSLDEIVDSLRDYINFAPYDMNPFEVETSFYGTPQETIPTEELTLFWKCGCLNCIDGVGQQLHSSLIASQKNGRDEISKRIWLGQQKILWPTLEQVRITLITRLEAQFGKKWPKTISDGLNIDQQVLETEIGTLSYALYKYQTRFPNKIPKTFTALAEAWKDVRNSLAHCKMVPYGQAQKAFILFKDFLKQ